MDMPQLKLLAARVRGLLDQHDVAVGHNQSLDLIAALPGLRNWPEVMAFPDRVAACELTANTASRLAHRLRSKHNVGFEAVELVTALQPPQVTQGTDSSAPDIWPTGPKPGVYVTTSQDAINALLRQYDDATDGELVYAEAAGSQWESAIDLGEYGLSSNGLARVPSGTLIVVGPVVLTQENWSNAGEKLDWACLRASSYGHRVAVLVETPQEVMLFKDVELAVRSVAPSGSDSHEALTGVVTEEGELVAREPFVKLYRVPTVATFHAPTDALSPKVIELLQARLKERSTGFLMLSSYVWTEHWGMEPIAAALALTDFVGPVARIKSRDRGTPAKDWMVPDIVKRVPFLASIESAYAHGFRRIILDPGYAEFPELMKYSEEVLFFIGGHSLEVDEAIQDMARLRSFDDLDVVYEKLVACASVNPIPHAGQNFQISDMFVPGAHPLPAGADFEAVTKHIRKHRVLRWEDELAQLLEQGVVTPEGVKETLEPRRGRVVDAFLTKWAKKKRKEAA